MLRVLLCRLRSRLPTPFHEIWKRSCCAVFPRIRLIAPPTLPHSPRFWPSAVSRYPGLPRARRIGGTVSMLLSFRSRVVQDRLSFNSRLLNRGKPFTTDDTDGAQITQMKNGG